MSESFGVGRFFVFIKVLGEGRDPTPHIPGIVHAVYVIAKR
ncbi:hypothetical protein [Pseudomonas sp. B21-015]|nr:hypothetical protein [Pseudomonas sp. B21-015]